MPAHAKSKRDYEVLGEANGMKMVAVGGTAVKTG
jgi:hypothetical protein